MAPEPRLHVAVTSDQPLVAEAIGAAIAGRGFHTLVLRWPGTPPSARGRSAVRARGAALPDVALMLSDLANPTQVRGATDLMAQLPVPWVVLAGVPQGPVWGALIDVGARLVVPNSTSLDEVVAMLNDVGRGRVGDGLASRSDLTSAWRRSRREHEELVARVASMTPREAQVLQFLYTGTPVRTIAEQLHVSEATVRSQVKRVLRKLDVRSQLAAVAAFEIVRSHAEAEGDDSLGAPQQAALAP